MAGFTLIEVLVAIAIFASLSVGAYQVLNQVQRSNEISAERTARLAELQRAMVIMDADFRQMALRQFRTDGEAPVSKSYNGKNRCSIRISTVCCLYAWVGITHSNNFHAVKWRKSVTACLKTA